MLELGQALQHSTWGGMVAQLMAAASIDADVARIQETVSEYHTQFETRIIARAVERGEIPKTVDPKHAALLFSAPIFYRHLFNRQATSATWITTHIDKTMALLAAG